MIKEGLLIFLVLMIGCVDKETRINSPPTSTSLFKKELNQSEKELSISVKENISIEDKYDLLEKIKKKAEI